MKHIKLFENFDELNEKKGLLPNDKVFVLSDRNSEKQMIVGAEDREKARNNYGARLFNLDAALNIKAITNYFKPNEIEALRKAEVWPTYYGEGFDMDQVLTVTDEVNEEMTNEVSKDIEHMRTRMKKLYPEKGKKDIDELAEKIDMHFSPEWHTISDAELKKHAEAIGEQDDITVK